jgi:hypothetical protein
LDLLPSRLVPDCAVSKIISNGQAAVSENILCLFDIYL